MSSRPNNEPEASDRLNDIENELIKMTTSSNVSKTQSHAAGENHSVHSSSMLSRNGGPPHQVSIKSESERVINGGGALSTKSGETATGHTSGRFALNSSDSHLKTGPATDKGPTSSAQP